MSGSFRPLTCCDSDCAGANRCQIGGFECESCGKWFCADEIGEDGLCEECMELAIDDDEDYEEEEAK